MGLRRRYHGMLLLLLFIGATEVLATRTASQTLRRFLKRKLPLHQRDLETRQTIHRQPTNHRTTDRSRRISIDLVGEYLQDDSFVAVVTQEEDRRGLRRKRTHRPQGKEKGSKSKGSKKEKDDSSILQRSKGSKRKKEAKGGKRSRGAPGGDGDIGSKSLNKICKNLDFGEFYDGRYPFNDASSKQKGSGGYYLVGKGGKGKRRQLKADTETRNRALQFEGELCSPNAYDVVKVDPDLSILAQLVEAANLENVFLCAGEW